MTDKSTAAAAQNPVQYIANKNGIRIGDRVYNKGEAVPVIEGRNYERAVAQGTLTRVMVAGGSIPQVSQMSAALASGAAVMQMGGNQLLDTATQFANSARPTDRKDIPGPSTEFINAAPIIKGGAAFWIGKDGAFVRVTVQDVQPIDAAAAEGLGMTPGQLAPKVLFEDEAEAEFVNPSALLPELPTARLIAELQAENKAEGQPNNPEPFPGIPLAEDASVFVLEDDAASTAFFKGVRFATAEDAEHYGVTEGEAVAVLEVFASLDDFTAGKKSEGLAALTDIIPGEVFTRISELYKGESAEGEQGEGGEEPEADAAFVEQLITERHALQLIVKAMRRGAEAGTELPDKMPLRKTILNNGLHNAEAFIIVAEGGPEALTLLDRVTDEQAQKLYEYALEQEWIEEPAPEPEAQATAPAPDADSGKDSKTE